MKNLIRFTIIITILVSFFGINSAKPARAAAEWIVTNTSDNGLGSLRQLIAEASDGDTITFDTSLAGETILLESNLIIDKDVAINGEGLSPQITVSGNNVAHLEVPTGRVVTFSNLIIAEGLDSGIKSWGDLTIENSTLRNNTGTNGGAIYIATGGVNITNSIFFSNTASSSGGAIYNYKGILEITNSTLHQNQAGGGGAIRNSPWGQSTIIESTLSQNQASIGGGIYGNNRLVVEKSTITQNQASSSGGGIYIPSDGAFPILISNSTISQNQTGTGSGGAIDITGTGTVHLTNSTITGNHSGNAAGSINMNGLAFLVVSNSTIAGNTASGTGEIQMTGAPQMALINSIVVCTQVNTTCYDYIPNNVGLENSIMGTGTLEEYGLAPLADNGGPTQTMALLPGSPAIDAGNNSTCEETDQRGATRPQGASCDIGAFEFSPLQVTNTNDSGEGSLRQAIEDASNGDTITFAPHLAGETIHLTSELEVDKSITIDGLNLNSRITISGDSNANGMRDDGDTQIMTIVEGSNVNIYNINFMYGKNNYSYNAGGIINYGSLTIQDALFSGNSGDTGGAILNNGNLTIQNCEFTGNLASEGGGIFNFGTLVMENSVLSNNSADIGGGVFNLGALEITDSNIFENSADTGGGGIVNSHDENNSGTLTITTSTISANTSDAGGGILNLALTGEVSISHSEISNNLVSITGGGISNFGTLRVENSTISGNSAEYGGGVISFDTLTMENVTLANNSAEDEGGGVANYGNSVITNSEFIENFATVRGGAVVNEQSATDKTIITSSVFTANSTEGMGGAIYIAEGDFTITGSEFIENFATVGGGAISTEGNTSISNSQFTGNMTDGDAGAIVNLLNGAVIITDSEFLQNSAYAAGAIGNIGKLTVASSLFRSNTAPFIAGAIGNAGGGIATISNSTITGNSSDAGGGVATDEEDTITTLLNVTISDNEGGGLYIMDGTVHLVNSILANSTEKPDCYKDTGNIATNTNNLIETTGDGEESCGTAFITDDPNLGPLADNGGPIQTMALLPGSPAIDAGDNNTCEETDQRGVTRPQGAGCDIGAFEFAPLQVQVTNTNDSGEGSLRQAIADASNGDTVNFASYLAGETIYLESNLIINKDVTIIGEGLSPQITVSGNNVAHLEVPTGRVVTLSNLIISEGLDSGIKSWGYLTIENSTLRNNTGANGGAIYNFGGTLTILDSMLNQNEATSSGGAVYNTFGGQITVTRSILAQNQSNGYGGAIYSSGWFDITESAIVQNQAYSGGGLFVSNANVSSISDSTIANNNANGNGGALHYTAVGDSEINIRNSTITENHAIQHAGAIYISYSSGQLLFFNSTIAGNPSGNTTEIMINGSAKIISSNSIMLCAQESANCFSLFSWSLILKNSIMETGALEEYGLAPLADNGGPTQTMALLPGSPAIDAGDNEFCPETDQRGVTRPQDGDNDTVATCDIGAYEYEYEYIDTTPPIVDTFTVPTSSNSLDIPITAFTASDNVGVTGYMITTSSDAPASDAAGWALTAPTTFTVTGNGTYTLHPWAKDAAGNVSALFETSPSVEVDTTLPSVLSITRADDNPTSAANVDFTVTFSEPVMNVDVDDFDLTTSGVTGATITEVNGSGAEYTVTVNTGTGSGTIRLDVLASANITDLIENLLAGLPYEDGETYDIQKSVVFQSIAAQDGWILESSETSNKGGTLNKGASTLNVGDDAANRQYRAMLSFDTTLPEGAVITGATLRFKYAGKTGTLPFSTHGKLLVDVKTGAFSNNPALAKGDFKASADKNGLFSLGKSTNWFIKVFTSSQMTYINTSGVTQFRLRFTKEDNNDFGADLLKIYSGSAGSNAPQLIVEYYVP